MKFNNKFFIIFGLMLCLKINAIHASCTECTNLEGFTQDSEIDDEIRHLVGKYRGGSGPKNVEIQRNRGVIETGLIPNFPNQAICPTIDSQQWAIDYTSKRAAEALHRGIDIPQPAGTPIIAVADGMVVGKFTNEGKRNGIEIILRHPPEKTGLAFWTYSQYTHLQEMPSISIGSIVKQGEQIGKTGNSGSMGKSVRRDALHFAILYSDSPIWSNDGEVVTPKDARFMDPNAFYRTGPPYDSQSISKLNSDQKTVLVPYIRSNGTKVPLDAKRIWPYACN